MTSEAGSAGTRRTTTRAGERINHEDPENTKRHEDQTDGCAQMNF